MASCYGLIKNSQGIKSHLPDCSPHIVSNPWETASECNFQALSSSSMAAVTHRLALVAKLYHSKELGIYVTNVPA